MADRLLEILERTRPGYDDERTWHRFLVDAYTGGGGFQGRVRQPDYSFWGAAADLYSVSLTIAPQSLFVPSQIFTYLDRHANEDLIKFRSRFDVSHYPNYVQALTDLKTSFMLRKEFTVENRPARVQAWRENVDGRGMTFDEVRPDIVMRAAILGWCPVLVDQDEMPDGVLSRAQAQQVGATPRLIPLMPANILEWSIDDSGQFGWVKIRTSYRDQPDPFSDAREVQRYTIWYPDRVHVFEVTGDDDDAKREVTDLGERQHGFGRVPLTVLRHAPDPDSCVHGIPMHGSVSVEARRLFNLISEFDEHIRSQVFSVLVYVSDNPPKELKLGTNNALHLSSAATKQHYYLSPPASVASSFEERIKNTIEEIYRQARYQYKVSRGADSNSGIAEQLKFRATNQAISDFAKHVARWEEDVDDLVGVALGVSEDARAAEHITAPSNFDIQDMGSAIKNAMDLVTLGVGPTAERLAKLRVVDEALPNLDTETRDQIEADLEEAEMAAAQQTSMDAAIAAAAATPDAAGTTADGSTG